MIKLIPDYKDVNYTKGLIYTYRSTIQQQLSSNLRREVAECLSDAKNWITNGGNLVDDIDFQCFSNKYTKILYVDSGTSKISIHCACKYSWKKTEKWQYGYDKGSQIWLFRKYLQANADYIALANRHLNQILLIPRSEILSATEVYKPVVNKITGKSKDETVLVIPLYENHSIEYFSRMYGNDTYSWSKRNLDGSSY